MSVHVHCDTLAEACALALAVLVACATVVVVVRLLAHVATVRRSSPRATRGPAPTLRVKEEFARNRLYLGQPGDTQAVRVFVVRAASKAEAERVAGLPRPGSPLRGCAWLVARPAVATYVGDGIYHVEVTYRCADDARARRI